MTAHIKTSPRYASRPLRPARSVGTLLMLISAALALLPYARMSAPDPAALADSPPTQRAMQTIGFLSQSTRSIGDAHHDAARDWLASELRGMGLEVQTQAAVVEGQPAPVVNVFARRAGTNPRGDAVLLMAHYDSGPGSPGASDNGSGTAIVLELARALTAAPRPANDLIVLFSDGEEQGILGVPPFLERHEWARSVRVALNFDGISTGPVFLWQSGPRNARLVALYAADTPRPMGVSWIDGIARVLPLDTDFRPFQQAGIAGASFSNPYLPVEYHTPLDRPELVNPASIRHGYEQGLALAQSLLDEDLSQPASADRVYLTLWDGLFLSYPAAAATTLGVLTGLLTLGILVWSGRRKTVRLGAVGAAALFTAANMLLMLLAQLAVELIVFATRPLVSPWIKIPGSLALMLLLLAVGYRRMQKRAQPAELLLGGQLIWAACAVWSSLANPLFSPPLTLILLASLLPHALSAPLPAPRLAPRAAAAGRMLALALILFLGAPVVYVLYRITGLIWIPAAIGAVALSMLLALVVPIQAMAD